MARYSAESGRECLIRGLKLSSNAKTVVAGPFTGDFISVWQVDQGSIAMTFF